MKKKIKQIFRRENEKLASQKPHIRLEALVHMAVSNLRFKKLRSILTMLGIAIGSGSIFLLISLGLGIQGLVIEQITQGRSVNSIDVSLTNSQILHIDDQTIDDFKAIKNVENASGYYTDIGKLSIKGTTAEVVTYGINDLYIETSNFIIKHGKMIDPKKQDQIVISSSILEALGLTNQNEAVDTKVSLEVRLDEDRKIEKELTISGITDSSGSTEVFISPVVFYDADETNYAGAKVLAKSRDDVSSIRKAIESRGFNTASPVDTLDQVDQFFSVLRIVLVSFGSIGMVIAVLGMINTLTVSLLERTREVALMNAIGARPRDMSGLFMLEAILLSLGGVLGGLISAKLISLVVDALLNQLARRRGTEIGFTVFSSPFVLVFLTIISVLAVGYIVAIIPARRAKYINAIQVLRKE